MRILVLNHNLVGEGTWLRASNIARRLAGAHAVTLLAVTPRRRLVPRREPCGDYHYLTTPFVGSRRLAASGFSVLDIIYRLCHVTFRPWQILYGFSSLPNVSLPFLWARRIFPRRIFISDWDDLFTDGGIYEYLNRGLTRPLYLWERRLEHAVRRRASLITVTSRYLERKARDIGAHAPVCYVPTGADVDRIAVQDRNAARAALGWPEDQCIVYYLGGGFNEDALLLLHAFALARARAPRLRLVMTGDPCVEYETAMAKHGITAAVRQTGRIAYARIPVYMAAADILAMPLHDCMNSRARGPIKLRDYLCAGRPIVGTALGEVAEVLARYPVGVLAGSDPDSFAEGLVTLAHDPARRTRLGREARRVAEEELSWRMVIRPLLDELRTIGKPT